LKLPPLRFHEPICPPCPVCSSEDVQPCVYPWPGRPLPFKGKGKLCAEPMKPGDPRFFCEKCQKGF